MVRLGMAYLFGEIVDFDYAEAIYWLSQAADKGSPEGNFYTGEMLRRGLGVDCNPGRASEWILVAAEKDYAPAQYALGKMYAEGEGLAINKVEATQWIQKAAEQDHELAKKWLLEQLTLVT